MLRMEWSFVDSMMSLCLFICLCNRVQYAQRDLFPLITLRMRTQRSECDVLLDLEIIDSVLPLL